jgi:hypothetical protein
MEIPRASRFGVMALSAIATVWLFWELLGRAVSDFADKDTAAATTRLIICLFTVSIWVFMAVLFYEILDWWKNKSTAIWLRRSFLWIGVVFSCLSVALFTVMIALNHYLPAPDAAVRNLGPWFCLSMLIGPPMWAAGYAIKRRTPSSRPASS